MNDASTPKCALCDTPMACTTPPGRAVRYFHCSKCGRWVAAQSQPPARAQAAAPVIVPAKPPRPAPAPAGRDVDRIKERLTGWLQSFDDSDPYSVLGVSVNTPDDQVRARFRELAMQSHPDQGGDPATIRRVIAAYDRIRNYRAAAASIGGRAGAPASRVVVQTLG